MKNNALLWGQLGCFLATLAMQCLLMEEHCSGIIDKKKKRVSLPIETQCRLVYHNLQNNLYLSVARMIILGILCYLGNALYHAKRFFNDALLWGTA